MLLIKFKPEASLWQLTWCLHFPVMKIAICSVLHQHTVKDCEGEYVQQHAGLLLQTALTDGLDNEQLIKNGDYSDNISSPRKMIYLSEIYFNNSV